MVDQEVSGINKGDVSAFDDSWDENADCVGADGTLIKGKAQMSRRTRSTSGQVVQFRVDSDDDRLYVRHDGSKEYSCQLEGTRLIRAGGGDVP